MFEHMRNNQQLLTWSFFQLDIAAEGTVFVFGGEAKKVLLTSCACLSDKSVVVRTIGQATG